MVNFVAYLIFIIFLRMDQELSVTPVSTMAAVSVKPPQFYQKNPEGWFRQLESQFHLAGITNSTTKYHHVMTVLPEDIACNLLSNDNTYETLKAEVINSLKENKHQLIEKALSTMSLGNKRPTQLVVEIRKRFTDIGMTAPEDLVKSRLVSALPPTIRTALVGHDDVSLEQFAKIADSMLSVSARETPFIGHTQAEPRYSSESSFERRQPDWQPRSRAHWSPRRRPFNPKRAKICTAHIYYADEARTCRHWCKWPGKRGKIIPAHQTTPHQSRPSSPVNT